jgi:uncharacterized lipoprotein YmbA
MRTSLTLIALAGALVLSACSTTPPARSTYLLRSDHTLGAAEQIKVGENYLGMVSVANYIDQPGLVLELSDDRIHTAKFHQWAEPLRVSLPDFLSAEIAAELGEALAVSAPAPTANGSIIEVRLSELHGDSDGGAVLVANWSLTSRTVRRDFQFAETIPLDGVGYDALVTAEKQLLVKLSQAIASELK